MKLLVTACILLCATFVPCNSDTVIAIFEPGTLVLPPGQASAPLASVQIGSNDVSTVLTQCNVQTVELCVPDFALSDTLGVSRTGEIVALVNLSNFVAMECDSANADTLIAQLKQIHSVWLVERDVQLEYHQCTTQTNICPPGDVPILSRVLWKFSSVASGPSFSA